MPTRIFFKNSFWFDGVYSEIGTILSYLKEKIPPREDNREWLIVLSLNFQLCIDSIKIWHTCCLKEYTLQAVCYKCFIKIVQVVFNKQPIRDNKLIQDEPGVPGFIFTVIILTFLIIRSIFYLRPFYFKFYLFSGIWYTALIVVFHIDF